jgi:hypothetical protein
VIAIGGLFEVYRQIGLSADQYSIFRDVSLIPFAYWSGFTPQFYYLLNSRKDAISTEYHLSQVSDSD